MSQSCPSERALKYRPDIDGLRAIAILLVVAFHYFSFHGGFIGVDVFFVISGYLITGIIMQQTSQGTFSYGEFYARRIRRIFPALLLVLVTCCIVGWFVLLSDEYTHLGKQVAAGAAYVANFLFWSQSGYFDGAATSKPLLHLWSLGVEEQFYLVWPALILVGAHGGARRVAWMIVVVVLLSFALNIYEVHRYAPTAFFMPYTRFWELGIGGLAAWWHLYRGVATTGRHVLSVLGMVLVLGSGQLLNDSMAFPGWLALPPTIGAALLIHAGPDAWLNRTVLRTRAMVFIGLISYPLYLWHWPFIGFMHLLYMHWPRAVNVSLLLASVVLAVLSWRFIETPIRRVSVSGSGARRFLLVGLGSALVVTVGGLVIGKGMLTSRFGDIQSISFKDVPSAAPAQHAGQTCAAGDGDHMPADTSVYLPCERNQFPGRPVVDLIGDSHAMALAGGLRKFLAAHQINMQMYAVVDCMPFDAKDRREACNEYNRFIMSHVRQQQPDLVVLSAYHLIYEQKWLTDTANGPGDNYSALLKRGLASISNEGRSPVLVIGEIPTWENALPWVLNNLFLRHRLPLPDHTLEGVVPESLAIDVDMQKLVLPAGGRYFSLRNFLCNASGCLTRVGAVLPDDLLVFDYGHLTSNGADYVVSHGLGDAVLESMEKSRKASTTR